VAKIKRLPEDVKEQSL